MTDLFEKLTRTFATSIRARLLLALTICLLISTHLSAQSGFLLTSPTQGSIVLAGQPITVTWTGGDPSDIVNLQFIDYVAYQVVDGIGGLPNSGSAVFTIGERFCGGQPNQFGFYIQNGNQSNYTYGPTFTVVCQLPQPPLPATSYDAVSNFSSTANPNGAWSYGWTTSLGSTFIPYNTPTRRPYPGIDSWEGPECPGDFLFPVMSFNHTGATYDYASGVSQPSNMLNLHPSCNGSLSVLRWTAPTSGLFNVDGLFQGIDTRNTSSDAHILHNSSSSVFTANINGFSAQAPFSFNRYFAAGDTLDFAVGWGVNGNFNADSTGLAVTITQIVSLESLGPAHLWLGLVNSDDQGTRFDLRVEIYRNNNLVDSGMARCISGVTRNPNNALEALVPFSPFSPVTYASGDVLSFRVLTRIGTNPNDTKCTGHNNAQGLTLYYDSAGRPSRFNAELDPDPAADLFLHTGPTESLSMVAPVASQAASKSSSPLNFSGGNQWKPIGLWSQVIP